MITVEKNIPIAVSCLSVLEYCPKILSNNIAYRPWPSFLAVLKGEYTYEQKDKTITVSAGEVLFLPKNTAYKYKISSPNAHTMQVTFNIFPDEINNSLPQTLTILDGKSSSQIISLFPKLLTAFRSNEAFAIFSLSSLIFQCLGIMTKQVAFSPYSKQIMPAVKFIEQNYNSDFPITHLSTLCHLSASQLRRLFVKETGFSPLKYKNRLRLEEACRLLDMGELNISEISDVMMFDTPYAFSKFFKNEMGISPNKYKKVNSNTAI